jgi:hypothetical protein
MGSVAEVRLEARRRSRPTAAVLARDDRFEEEPPTRSVPVKEEPRPKARGTADDPVTAEWEREYRLVLAELDFLHRALGEPRREPRREEPESFPIESPPPSAPAPPTRDIVPEPHGMASPYLEDRLEAAHAAAAELSGEFAQMERRGSSLRVAVQTIEDELVRASDELAFLRERQEREYDPPPNGLPTPTPAGRLGPAPPEVPRAPPYEQFTAERYNRTVRDAAGRRRRVAAYTIALATIISAALLAVTLLIREPFPTPWVLGLLPVVWLVPVPFFLVSFRGSQRVLGNHPLDVAEAP